jgi:hypothetical protein
VGDAKSSLSIYVNRLGGCYCASVVESCKLSELGLSVVTGMAVAAQKCSKNFERKGTCIGCTTTGLHKRKTN